MGSENNDDDDDDEASSKGFIYPAGSNGLGPSDIRLSQRTAWQQDAFISGFFFLVV